ncbi:ClC family H(+)/Cl(-) exchange transporter [Paraclostridium bifermentans]|uniref:ClC family H(+)/Cl(-) exchange transporter n=1 Tax=Paraclostridium bifermentans TaxID=1490 RepID=UPI002911FD66|nr:ClC family H(+)/Cl(-) exchange transporter [Paraclostridium bifermentans]MDU3804222.1 ClC family H(+)/Cl(-) exchange transporter [Paraclostridium bifermentans]
MENAKYNLKIILKSIVIGGCGGFVVSMYRLCTSYAQKISLRAYHLMSEHFIYTILGILVFAIIGYVVGYSVEKEPMISGSGIPQIEGCLKGKLNIIHSFKILKSKFINGVLAMGAGLSLGIEGPSIQLAASFAHGISSKLKLDKLESNYLYSSGAGAGLAAAFNAPFAGVMFVLEEVHKSFSPMLFVTSIAACVSSDLVTWLFFGEQHTLKINKLISIPSKYYILLVILGIVIGVCGVIYNKGLLKTIDIFSNINCKTRYKMIISFMFAILFGIFLPQVLGGGDDLINNLFSSGVTIKMAIILLASKYIFSLISFAPNTPGGILFPILTLGSLVGIIFAKISLFLVGIDTNLINNIIILSMAGMFASVVRAPITGLILVFEMSGAFTQLGPSIVVCGVAYMVANLLNCPPIYDSLLENKIKIQNK